MPLALVAGFAAEENQMTDRPTVEEANELPLDY
jgi:hypothetical protein